MKFHAQMVGLMRFQKPHKLAESAEIRHKLAESAHSANGFYRLLKGVQHLAAGKTRVLQGRFERKNPLRESNEISISGRCGQLMP